MPFVTSPQYDTPPDATPIWRYYPIHRFAQLVAHGLFVPTFATLRQGDRCEAAFTAGELQHLDRANREGSFEPHLAAQIEDVTTRHVYVSCWCESDHEGADMWSRYVGPGQDAGVAVASSILYLKEVFEQNDSPMHVGRCTYDYDLGSEGHVQGPRLYLRKRPVFRHENEVRAVLVDPRFASKGMNLPIEAEHLIREVRLCPGATPRFRQDVENLLRSVRVPAARVRNSEMDLRPPDVPRG
jgi:hypothetical protein